MFAQKTYPETSHSGTALGKIIIEPSHEIMILFVLRKLILQTCMRSHRARCLIFGWTLRLLPYLECANSEGSAEAAQMRRLAWASAGRLGDKYMYYNLMSWVNLTCERNIQVFSTGQIKFISGFVIETFGESGVRMMKSFLDNNFGLHIKPW